jgi:hypothetical protein
MSDRIQIGRRYPSYWEYDGEPVLLLGGSVEDNLFQIPDLEAQLDLLAAAGGNYVRCTMSSRDEGDVWPFARAGDTHDLNAWNEEYWRRFDAFLALTDAHGVFVQLEVWATFDFYRAPWQANPFNPKNNCNYTAAESGLPVAVATHPTRTENPFFWSVPAEDDNRVVLHYQQRFVDRLLASALPFGHVLYCMDNETSVTPAWGEHWSRYIAGRATERGLNVETTEMWDAHNLDHEQHRATFEHPDVYSFVDISQNNHQRGQTHWDNMQAALARLTDPVRPANNVKIYGAPGSQHSDEVNGLDGFWRNIFGGCASVRFHRPDCGYGLSRTAQVYIRSARMLADAVNVFACVPQNDLLSERAENAAYCMARPGVEAAVFFTDSGEIVLDTRMFSGSMELRWLDVSRSEWLPPETCGPCTSLRLTCPRPGHMVAVVKSAFPRA